MLDLKPFRVGLVTIGHCRPQHELFSQLQGVPSRSPQKNLADPAEFPEIFL